MTPDSDQETESEYNRETMEKIMSAINLEPEETREAVEAIASKSEADIVAGIKALAESEKMIDGPMKRYNVLKTLERTYNRMSDGKFSSFASFFYLLDDIEGFEDFIKIQGANPRGCREYAELNVRLLYLQTYEIVKNVPENVTGPEMMEAGYKKARRAIKRHWKISEEEAHIEKNAEAREKQKEYRAAQKGQKEKAAAELAAKIEKLAQEAPAVPDQKSGTDGFLNMPTSAFIMAFFEGISTSEHQERLSERKGNINKGAEISVLKSGNKRKIEYQKKTRGRTTSVTIRMDDFAGLVRRNELMRKFTIFVLKEAARQSIHGGQLTKPFVTFSLEDLVSSGMYESEHVARNEFVKAIPVLTSNSYIGGYVKRGSKIRKAGGGQLFTWAGIENNICKVNLQTEIDWSLLAECFAVTPEYILKLSGRPQELLLYISLLARQNTDKIKERGYFTVSMRAIQLELDLQDETETPNPGRIRDAIESALTIIEDEQRQTGENYLKITPVFNDTGRIADFLDGYLKVEVFGRMAGELAAISDSKQEKISKAQKLNDQAKKEALKSYYEKQLEKQTEPEPEEWEVISTTKKTKPETKHEHGTEPEKQS